MKSPEFASSALGFLVILLGLSFRGAKAKFTNEIIDVMDKKFVAAATLKEANDKLVTQSIETLQADMSAVKVDVHDMAQDIKKLLQK